MELGEISEQMAQACNEVLSNSGFAWEFRYLGLKGHLMLSCTGPMIVVPV